MCYSRLQLPYLVFRRRFCGTATTCSVSPNGKRNSEKENVIVISGPTGAGKSRIALELAKGLNITSIFGLILTCILSGQSIIAHVYRGLDVGSARPSATDRKVRKECCQKLDGFLILVFFQTQVLILVPLGTDRRWNIYRMSLTSGCELPWRVLWVFEQISASFPVIFRESQPLEEYRSKKKHMEFDLP